MKAIEYLKREREIYLNSINNFILQKLHEGLSYEQGTY